MNHGQTVQRFGVFGMTLAEYFLHGSLKLLELFQSVVQLSPVVVGLSNETQNSCVLLMIFPKYFLLIFETFIKVFHCFLKLIEFHMKMSYLHQSFTINFIKVFISKILLYLFTSFIKIEGFIEITIFLINNTITI